MVPIHRPLRVLGALIGAAGIGLRCAVRARPSHARWLGAGSHGGASNRERATHSAPVWPFWEDAAVDRAVELLGAAGGCVGGTVPDLRRRMDAVLDELFPPSCPPTRRERWSRRLGVGARARAADAALEDLLGGELPFGARAVGVRFGASKECTRYHVAGVLESVHRALRPHEAARHDEIRRRIWAATRDESRKRDFIDRCLGRRDRGCGHRPVRHRCPRP